MSNSTFYLIGRRIGGEINALKEVISGGGLPHAEMFVGMLAHFPMPVAPPGWLIADGRAVSREQYAALFAYLGTYFGPGDGATTFNLPKADDRYLRGASGAHSAGDLLDDMVKSHKHTGNTSPNGGHSHGRGTMEISADLNAITFAPDGGVFRSASGAFKLEGSSYRTGPDGWGGTISGAVYKLARFMASRSWTGLTSTAGGHSHGLNIDPAGGDETRPKTFVGLLCIKY